MAYAGAFFETDNTSYYIAQNASTGATWWWTMSPSYWNSSGEAGEFIVGGSTATGYLGYTDVGNTGGVRPVLSLKACVQYASGNGTSEKPYEVKLSESCESVENEVLDENVVRISATTNDSTMATVVAPASVLKNIGDSHTFTFNVTEGYEYKNVEGCTGTYNEENNTLTISSIATSTTCVVNFEKATYEVNVSSNNTSYGTVSPTTQTVEEGGSVTITLSPNTGYKYSSNTCGGTVSENTMTISNITAAKTCTVTFAIKTYSVSVTSTNTSYGTVSPTTQTVEEGGSVTVTLSPATGYKYSSNTCGGTVSGNTMTISNITAAKTCTVTFTTDRVTFTLATSGNYDTTKSATEGAACSYVYNYYGGYLSTPTTTTFSYTYNGTTYNNCKISGTPTCKYATASPSWTDGTSFSCASYLWWYSGGGWGSYNYVHSYAGCSTTVTCSN